jgi:Cu-Zn family superoxide dismutase
LGGRSGRKDLTSNTRGEGVVTDAGPYFGRLSGPSRGYAEHMIKRVTAAIALLAAPVAVMSGCSNQSSNNPSTSTTSGSASSAQTLKTQLNTSDGKHVADATVDFTSGYATVTVETVAAGVLSPGFHGLHIHAVGTCDPNSAFASAGEHFQAPGHSGQPASGDLPPLLARSDGSGKLVATSDGFTMDQLKGSEGSSIVLHQGADLTGQSAAESDQRIACGVLSPASTTSTSVSTSTSTSTVTTSAATPVPPATVTETTSSTAPTSSTSAVPSTSTSTVTVIQPTLPPITIPQVPAPNGG